MKKINNQFATNVLYPTVKKNRKFGEFTDKNGVRRFHKFVKVTFVNKHTSHKDGSPNVVCTLDCMLTFDLPDYMINALMYAPETNFQVVGVAVCSSEDDFNLEKGKLIAQAKAENEAYRVAGNMLATLKNQIDNLSEALNKPMDDLVEYRKHNETFIDKVIDGEIKPKY
jgi:hypothetical protein